MNALDNTIRTWAGPEPTFDSVVTAFLENCRDELRSRLRPGSLLEAVDLGDRVPWLWRLAFRTIGISRLPDGTLTRCENHVVAVRYLPDCLRRVDRFQSLALIEPKDAFHPNLREQFICLEMYPGQPLVELCDSLHALFSWRLRQLVESDALNPAACTWGRANVEHLPLDRRPLFGRTLTITLERVEEHA